MWDFLLVVTVSAEKDTKAYKTKTTGLFQRCVFPDHNKHAGCEVNDGSQPQQSHRFHKISSEEEEEGLVRITIPVWCGCLLSNVFSVIYSSANELFHIFCRCLFQR